MQSGKNHAAVLGGVATLNPEPRNLPASVHRRLLNEARKSDRQFGELLRHYMLERFLFRLSMSPHAENFLLKGAMLLRGWMVPAARPTLDIDLLGRMPNDALELAAIMSSVCLQSVVPDGLLFDAESVRGISIAQDAIDEGARVTFHARLGKAILPMQVDVGFGDAVTPDPTIIELPVILDLPAPRLHGYPRETVVAEKAQILVKLGLLTSRMKDIYDLWLLSTNFDFNGAVLTQAFGRTFARRGTAASPLSAAFTSRFARDPAKFNQWAAFARKMTNAPTLEEAHAGMVDFVVPILRAVAQEAPTPARWTAAAGWDGISG